MESWIGPSDANAKWSTAMPHAPQFAPVPLDAQRPPVTSVPPLVAAPAVPLTKLERESVTPTSLRTPETVDQGFARMLLMASIAGSACYYVFAQFASWLLGELRPLLSL